jgi:hypothetical protein
VEAVLRIYEHFRYVGIQGWHHQVNLSAVRHKGQFSCYKEITKSESISILNLLNVIYHVYGLFTFPTKQKETKETLVEIQVDPNQTCKTKPLTVWFGMNH